MVAFLDSPNSTTVESHFFDNEEAYDYQPWIDALQESAPVCLKRPPVLAPSNLFFIFSNPALLLMNKIESPRMTRGPPLRLVA
jgi:hypothetical protein